MIYSIVNCIIIIFILFNVLLFSSNESYIFCLTPQQEITTKELTSIFENSTPTIQYDYCENIGDGRGITAGEAGFCSGTGDMLLVVQEYTKLEPNNKLAKYLPVLIEVNGSNSTTGLEPYYCNDWSDCALNDPLFRQVQDDITNELYYNPSQQHCIELGLILPLSQGQMYDAIIQHGDDEDPDSINSLINRTISVMNGSPSSNPSISEKLWLTEFLHVRAKDLLNCSDVDSREEWAESVDRVYCYERIIETGNWNLELPMTVEVWNTTWVLTEGNQEEYY